MGENKAYPSDAFFKVLLDSSSPIISIPPNFIRRFGDKLLEKCVLEANGKSYNVKCEKIGKLHYFTNGWLKFVEAYGLEDGYFLEFQLNQETSSFSVVVFDLSQTACFEKQHHPDALPSRENCVKVKEEQAESSDKHQLPGPLPHSDKRARMKEEPDECADEQRLPRSRPSSNKRRRGGKVQPLACTSSEETETDAKNLSKPYIKIESEDGDDDLNEGHEGSSECSHLSFSVTFKNRNWMAIPKDVAVKTGMVNQRRVTLKDVSGKKWPVDLKPKKDGEMKLTNGWEEFQKAFKVDRNVTCTFEFRKRSPNVLKVTVKRGKGRPYKIK
ncbi:hypothetical protein Leryth_015099 [Lithospermum erythrorhizon]|nr:hypothetical protein Leryth_015099 [Lithospermum erythrorhizon]